MCGTCHRPKDRPPSTGKGLRHDHRTDDRRSGDRHRRGDGASRRRRDRDPNDPPRAATSPTRAPAAAAEIERARSAICPDARPPGPSHASARTCSARRSSARAWMSSSATRAASSCRSTTSRTVYRESVMCSCVTSRGPRMRLTGTPGRAARVGVCLGTIRTGGDEPRDRHRDSPAGFDSDRHDHRQRARRAHRQGRVPGDDISDITLPMTKHNYLLRNATNTTRHCGGLHVARTGRPGPSTSTSRGRADERDRAEHPETLDLPGFKPTIPGPSAPVPSRCRGHRAGAAAGRSSPATASSSRMRSTSSWPSRARPSSQSRIRSSASARSTSATRSATATWACTAGSTSIGQSSRPTCSSPGDALRRPCHGQGQHVCAERRIIHVDIDPSEIGKNVAVDIPIVGDVGRVLRASSRPSRGRSGHARGLLRGAGGDARGVGVGSAGTARARGAMGCCRPTTSSHAWAS